MQRLGRQTDDMEQVIPVEEDLEVHEKRQLDFSIMENAMAKIGEPCKSLLDAYYIQKNKMQQIATEFDIPMPIMQKPRNTNALWDWKKPFFAQYKTIL